MLTFATTTPLLDAIPAWAFMWLLVAAIYGGLKVLMLLRARGDGARASTGRVLGYFFAWPGLDARAFLAAGPPAGRPAFSEWRDSIAHIVLGAALFWGLTRFALPLSPVLAGWVAMTGLVFILHFGLFRAMTLAWRAAGVDAPLMMVNPLRSTSVTEFWGKRWNRDFRIVAHDLIFRPLHRRLGGVAAVLIVFLFSGLVHELVISVPARAGFGLPMAYFLIQFAGLAVEASPLARRWRIGRGPRGWMFTFIIVAMPAVALFHPWFVERVILPFAAALGAT